MIELPYWAFVAYTQAMFFSILGMVILFILFRKQKKRAVVIENNLNEELSFNKIKLYFDMEVKITRGQNERLQQKGELSLDEKVETTLLQLRADLLEVESEYSEKDVADPDYWRVLLDHYIATFKRHDLIGAIESKFSEEHEDVHALFESQEKELKDLLDETNQLESDDEQLNNLSTKLHKLANSHRELSGCVFVLEDENRFLREQVATLLKGN